MKPLFHLTLLLAVLFQKQYCLAQPGELWIDERRIALYFDEEKCWTYSYAVDGRFLIKDDKLFIERQPSYESGERIDYSRDFVPGKNDLVFQVCKKTDSTLLLHPLNLPAISASDEMGFQYPRSDREKWPEKYLADLTGAVKKVQRDKVIQKWRDQHNFYVDTLRFRLWSSLYEKARFDSLCYSTMTYDFSNPDSVTYHDLRLGGDGRFVSRWSKTFAPKANRVRLVPLQEEILFIPPLPTDEVEIEAPEEEIMEINPAMQSYLDKRAGTYKGKISEVGMRYLNDQLSEIGISTAPGNALEKNIDFIDESSIRLRVYYNGTCKDFVLKQGINMDALLQEFIMGLDLSYGEFTEFESYTGARVAFPISYINTPFKAK